MFEYKMKFWAVVIIIFSIKYSLLQGVGSRRASSENFEELGHLSMGQKAVNDAMRLSDSADSLLIEIDNQAENPEENEELYVFAAELYDAAGNNYLLASSEPWLFGACTESAREVFECAANTIKILASNCREFEACITYDKRAIDLYLKAGDYGMAALCFYTLAETYKLMGICEYAAKMYKQAGILFEENNQTAKACKVYQNAASNFHLAHLYSQENKCSADESRLRQSLDHELNHHAVKILEFTGYSLRKSNTQKQALDRYLASTERFSKIENDSRGVNVDEHMYAMTQKGFLSYKIAKIYEQEKEVGYAIIFYKQATQALLANKSNVAVAVYNEAKEGYNKLNSLLNMEKALIPKIFTSLPQHLLNQICSFLDQRS